MLAAFTSIGIFLVLQLVAAIWWASSTTTNLRVVTGEIAEIKKRERESSETLGEINERTARIEERLNERLPSRNPRARAKS